MIETHGARDVWRRALTLSMLNRANAVSLIREAIVDAPHDCVFPKRIDCLQRVLIGVGVNRRLSDRECIDDRLQGWRRRET